MTMGVFDFKSIRRSLERQEQKAEFEEKNPTSFVDPVTAKVVWTPEQGYGTAAVPYGPWRYVGEPFPEPEFQWSEDKLVTAI